MANILPKKTNWYERVEKYTILDINQNHQQKTEKNEDGNENEMQIKMKKKEDKKKFSEA